MTHLPSWWLTTKTVPPCANHFSEIQSQTVPTSAFSAVLGRSVGMIPYECCVTGRSTSDHIFSCVRKFWKRATKVCVLWVKLMCVRKDGGEKWKKFIKEEKICSWAVLTSCLIIITFQRGGKIFHKFPSLLSKLVPKLVSWKRLNAIISSEGIFVGNVFFNYLLLKPQDTEWLERMIC